MALATREGVATRIKDIEASVYTVPTDLPEADGTIQWNSTTMVLVEAGKPFVRSTAALRVCRRLTGLWPLFYGLMLIPKRWRDQAYALIARNRKRWFKARSECPIMPPEWRRRFIS